MSTPKDYENWQEGDIAECVVEHDWTDVFGVGKDGPKKGDRHRVVAVTPLKIPFLGWLGTCISFKVFQPNQFCGCKNCFRKVVPVKDEATTDESITLDMLIGKPVPVKETT